MIRKYFCKDTPIFHEKQLRILFYIASKKENEIITQTDMATCLNIAVTTLNHHIKILRKEELVDKLNHLTNKAKRLFILNHIKNYTALVLKKICPKCYLVY